MVGVVSTLTIKRVSALLSGTTSNSGNTYTASSCFLPVPVTAGTGGNIFAPATMTIAAGCSVKWTQTSGGGGHNSTSDTSVWVSPNPIGQNNTYTFLFTTAGNYPYKCTRHPGSMTGTITVT